MASPNISELVTTTIESRRKKLADNMSDNTALLSRLKQSGKIITVSGGTEILEELEYAENSTYKRISGYDPIDISPSQVFTSAKFDLKESIVVVSMSNRERLQNAGPEQMIDLLEKRIGNAEKTMINNLSGDLYSDGTASAGKQVGGLRLAIPSDPAMGTYGGIPRGTWRFWRPQKEVTGANPTGAKLLETMMKLWVRTCRNMDKVDLISADNHFYQLMWSALQQQERFTNTMMAKAGFTNLKFITADVVLDGGVRHLDNAGSVLHPGTPASSMYFLNTDYIRWRPHRDANMTQLDERIATNQAAFVRPLYWAGNLTASNCELQGLLTTA